MVTAYIYNEIGVRRHAGGIEVTAFFRPIPENELSSRQLNEPPTRNNRYYSTSLENGIFIHCTGRLPNGNSPMCKVDFHEDIFYRGEIIEW